MLQGAVESLMAIQPVLLQVSVSSLDLLAAKLATHHLQMSTAAFLGSQQPDKSVPTTLTLLQAASLCVSCFLQLQC